MKSNFLNIRLEALSVYELMVIWTEIKLIVSPDGNALLTGNGFAPDIAWAFNTLIPAWQAKLHLTLPPLGLAPGNYPLNYEKDLFFVTRNQKRYFLEDQPVLVEVLPSEQSKINPWG